MQWAVYGVDYRGANVRIMVEAGSAPEAEQQARGQNIVDIQQIYPITPQAVLPYGAAGSPLALVMKHAKWVRVWSVICGVLAWVLIAAIMLVVVAGIAEPVFRREFVSIFLILAIGSAMFLAAQAGLNLLASLAVMAQDVVRSGPR